jgi:fibronectin type 3 domain-containing protein
MKKLAVVLLLCARAFAAHSVILSFTQTTDPVALNCLYRATASGSYDMTKPLTCSTSPVTTFTDNAVVAGDSWFYVVTAVSSKGTSSKASNEVNAVIPLLPPSGLSATSN